LNRAVKSVRRRPRVQNQATSSPILVPEELLEEPDEARHPPPEALAQASSEDFDPTLPTPTEAGRARINTMLHVPRVLRSTWNQLLCQEVKGFLARRSKLAFQRLCLLAKSILCASPRGGKAHLRKLQTTVKQRMDRWRSGDLAGLWEEALKTQLCGRKQARSESVAADELDPRVVERVITAAAEGALSKACQVLSQETKLADLDEATFLQLERLHPLGPEVVVEPAPPCIHPFGEEGVTTKSLLRALKSFKPLTAPGPTGLRMNHIREALDASLTDRNVWLAALQDWVTTSASGQLPCWCAPDYCAARLVPLQKKQGGIRPVAVGEILRRLTSRLLMQHHLTQLRSRFSPHQLGVGMKGATEHIVRKLRQVLRAHPKAFVLQVDLSNAFNCVDRSAAIAAFSKDAPELAAWCQFTYRLPTHLHSLW
jgi:hypothetical protein